MDSFLKQTYGDPKQLLIRNAIARIEATIAR